MYLWYIYTPIPRSVNTSTNCNIYIFLQSFVYLKYLSFLSKIIFGISDRMGHQYWHITGLHDIESTTQHDVVIIYNSCKNNTKCKINFIWHKKIIIPYFLMLSNKILHFMIYIYISYWLYFIIFYGLLAMIIWILISMTRCARPLYSNIFWIQTICNNNM